MKIAPPPTRSSEKAANKAGAQGRADQRTRPPSSPMSLLADLGCRAAMANEPLALLRDAARAVAQLLATSHCGVCQMHSAGDALSAAIWNVGAGADAAALRTYTISLSSETMLGACAVRQGRTVAVANLAESQHRDAELARLGIAAAAAAPLLAGGTAYGALNVFHHSPREFGPDQIELLEAASHVATAALLRCRAELRLAREQRLARSLRDSMESLMLVVGADGRIVEVNRACCEASGFAAQDLVGRSFFSALLLAEENAIVKRALARIQGGQPCERFDSYILTKDGQRRRIAWSVASLESEDRDQPGIIASGIDISDRCEAVERAVRAEALAQDARRLAAELTERIKDGEQSLAHPAVAGRLPQGVEYDRRARIRRKYKYRQLIAPLGGGQLPPDSEFVERDCYDISSRGFAFLLPQPPRHERVVVAFGAAPSVVYLTADIRHVTLREIDGRPQYVVGCRYTGRLTREG